MLFLVFLVGICCYTSLNTEPGVVSVTHTLKRTRTIPTVLCHHDRITTSIIRLTPVRPSIASNLYFCLSNSGPGSSWLSKQWRPHGESVLWHKGARAIKSLMTLCGQTDLLSPNLMMKSLNTVANTMRDFEKAHSTVFDFLSEEVKSLIAIRATALPMKRQGGSRAVQEAGLLDSR